LRLVRQYPPARRIGYESEGERISAAVSSGPGLLASMAFA
jgi:hypothetical protein